MNQDHGLWVERYRPDTLDNYIGNEHLLDKARIWIEQQEIPHLLLYGPAGTGKCLDFSERINIEIELTEEEAKIMSKYM